MSIYSKIQWRGDTTGSTIYATVQNTSGEYYQTTTGTFVSLVVANWANYDVPLTETPASSYWYLSDWPDVDYPAYYTINLFLQAGGAPAISDTLLTTRYGLAISAPPEELEIVQDISNVTRGESISIQIRVIGVDGSLVTESIDSVSAAIYSGKGYLSGTLSKQVINGIATFDDLSISDSGRHSLIFRLEND